MMWREDRTRVVMARAMHRGCNVLQARLWWLGRQCRKVKAPAVVAGQAEGQVALSCIRSWCRFGQNTEAEALANI